MASTRDKIFEFVKKEGAVFPSEVASAVGIDSFVASAFLSELIEGKNILASKERIGGTPVYYVSGFENAVKKKLSGVEKSDIRVAQKSSRPVSNDPETIKKREEFAKRLEAIEAEEQKRSIKPKEEPKSSFAKSILKAVKGAVEKPRTQKKDNPKPVIRKPEIDPNKPTRASPAQALLAVERKIKDVGKVPKKKGKAKQGHDDLLELTLTYFGNKGAKIISNEQSKRSVETSLVVEIPTSIGSVRFLVKIKDKKKINEADLSLVYNEGVNKKLPVIYMTRGDLVKSGKEFLKDTGDLLRVKKFE